MGHSRLWGVWVNFSDLPCEINAINKFLQCLLIWNREKRKIALLLSQLYQENGWCLHNCTNYLMIKRNNFSRRARGLDLTPIEGKWISGSLIDFLQNYQLQKKPFGGAKIKETDGFCASVPLVALEAGKPDLYVRVKEVVTTLSSWPTSVSHGQVAARFLEQFILNKGGSTRSAYVGP